MNEDVTFEDFVPTLPKLVRAWKRLDDEGRHVRFAEARRCARIVKAVANRPANETVNAARRKLSPPVPRSTLQHWMRQFAEYGFEGLFDWRMPEKPRELSDGMRQVVCTLRRADPNVSIGAIKDHLKKHHDTTTSESTIKRVLKRAGLARPCGPARGNSQAGEVRLELGGMMLVAAANRELKYTSSMATGIREVAVEVAQQSKPQLVDTSGRDELGRFVSEYNERNRKLLGDVIGPAFRSVEIKRAEKDLSRLHLVNASVDTIERKLWALLATPLLGDGRWDGVRNIRGKLLGELCGFEYMPDTLDLFTREMKYVGVQNTMWEIHARMWLPVSKRWGGERAALLLYVDGTNKPVWTDLFSQATKVTSVGRVMPGVELIALHTGYGVPLWMATSSGRAPLVTLTPKLLKHVEETLPGAEVGRIVVIDAEGNSLEYLKALEQGTPARGWVTRMKPSWVEGLEIVGRTPFQPYRNGDRIRMGEADLGNEKTTPFRVRVIEIQRRGKEIPTYLGASTLLRPEEWAAVDVADVYFDRWPMQEAQFRAVNRAVDFKAMHGYGKQLVDNITVVQEIDELKRSMEKGAQRLSEHERKNAELGESVREAEAELLRKKRQLEAVERQAKEQETAAERITPSMRRLWKERRELSEKVEKEEKALAKRRSKWERDEKAIEAKRERRGKNNERMEKLESRRKIFQHDVELDSIFSVLKVGLVMLVTYVLNEYLGGARMEPTTFLTRIATLPARLRRTPHVDILTFEYNTRDPDAMALLSANCEAINARKLRSEGDRILRVQVAPAPVGTPRPRSRTQWSKMNDRIGRK